MTSLKVILKPYSFSGLGGMGAMGGMGGLAGLTNAAALYTGNTGIHYLSTSLKQIEYLCNLS